MGETDGMGGVSLHSGRPLVLGLGEHGTGECRGVLSDCSAEVSTCGRGGLTELTGWLDPPQQWTDNCDGIKVSRVI